MSTASTYTLLSHVLYAWHSFRTEHVRPMQQRAAAAAQALVPGSFTPQREIQAMLEKNETALKGWNTLHKQQPVKTSPDEHKEWVRRCLLFRQQIGARLEVLASLADKQIAQEDDKNGRQQGAAAAGPAQNGPNLPLPTSNTTLSQHQSMAGPQQRYLQPQGSTMASSNLMTMTIATSIEPPIASSSVAISNMAAPTMFPEPPMPTVGFASPNPNMFFPTQPINPMQTSSGFSSTMSLSSNATSTSGYAMSSGGQTYTPNMYMTATSGPLSSSAPFINQQNYMMSGGMIHPHHFMPMSMPMNMAVSGSENLYAHPSYDMASSTNNVISGISTNNSSTNSFAVDPFMTPLGFGTAPSFESTDFSMGNMPSMSIQQPQLIGSINGGNYGAQEVSMMPNSFGYGDMPPSSSMMPQSMPNHVYTPTPHLYHQQNQLSHHHQSVGSMSMPPDVVMYGDSNVNIFEGLTDDAFFPMQ